MINNYDIIVETLTMIRRGGLMDELDKFVPKENKHMILESRAKNVIAAAINLMDSIQENYNMEDSEDLQKRLYLAIRGQDENKFIRKIREIEKRDKVDNKGYKHND